MSDSEARIRALAYRLWEEAGRPEGQSEVFWFAAKRELESETAAREMPPDAAAAPPAEPPKVAAQHGAPVGLPGERIAEQGVLDDRLGDLVQPAPSRSAPN